VDQTIPSQTHLLELIEIAGWSRSRDFAKSIESDTSPLNSVWDIHAYLYEALKISRQQAREIDTSSAGAWFWEQAPYAEAMKLLAGSHRKGRERQADPNVVKPKSMHERLWRTAEDIALTPPIPWEDHGGTRRQYMGAEEATRRDELFALREKHLRQMIAGRVDTNPFWQDRLIFSALERYWYGDPFGVVETRELWMQARASVERLLSAFRQEANNLAKVETERIIRNSHRPGRIQGELKGLLDDIDEGVIMTFPAIRRDDTLKERVLVWELWQAVGFGTKRNLDKVAEAIFTLMTLPQIRPLDLRNIEQKLSTWRKATKGARRLSVPWRE
jgi:hypothetical protein